MSQLQKVVVRDSELATRVLKLASSSAFGGQPAHSLTVALQRLVAKKPLTVGDEQIIRELGFEVETIVDAARQAFSAGV